MYILQHAGFALGNFINITPAIAWLHEQHRKHTPLYSRIPVYFSTPYVRECFTDWEAIHILDERPDAGPMYGSNITCPTNQIPDYQYAFQEITGQEWQPRYHTYVDTPKMNKRERDDLSGAIVIINGAGNDDPAYVATKDPGMAAFVDAVAGATLEHPQAKVIAVGSQNDLGRCPWLKDIADEAYFGNIRLALKIISRSAVVIANDTGLAHAAGAMNKDLTVLMKNTPLDRVKNPGKNTRYVYS